LPWKVPIELPVASIHVPATLPEASIVPVQIDAVTPFCVATLKFILPFASTVPLAVRVPPSAVPLMAPQLSTVICQVPVSLPNEPHVPWYWPAYAPPAQGSTELPLEPSEPHWTGVRSRRTATA